MKRRDFITKAAILIGPSCSFAEQRNENRRSSPRRAGSDFEWNGEIGGKEVKITLKAGPYTLKKSDTDWMVDNYPTPHGIGAANSDTHIHFCSVKWGKRTLPIVQNVFTSVFQPWLGTAEDPTLLTGELPANTVGVFPSDSGDSCVLTIPSISSAQKQVNMFTITNKGKVYRSTVIHVI